MRQAGSLQAIYEKYGKEADFWWIYTKEAHASDSDRPNKNTKIAEHKTFEDRKKAASTCATSSPLKVPVLVDDMKDSAATAFNALPERFLILGKDGKMVYSGSRGPRGVDTAELEKTLKATLKK